MTTFPNTKLFNFNRKRGMRWIGLRKQAINANYEPFKTLMFGRSGRVIKMWDSESWKRVKLNSVRVVDTDYTLSIYDDVVVFTATATATLPPATGSAQTPRLVCRAGTLTVAAFNSETIKGSLTQTLYPGEDLIITDIATGIWE